MDGGVIADQLNRPCSEILECDGGVSILDAHGGATGRLMLQHSWSRIGPVDGTVLRLQKVRHGLVLLKCNRLT